MIIFIAISVFSTIILLAVPHKLIDLRQAIVVIIGSLRVSSPLIRSPIYKFKGPLLRKKNIR